MADDGIQPLGRTPPLDGAVRAGAPGSPSDSVVMSRTAPPKPKTIEKPTEIKDSFREIIETVVFVIVLVFMLKTFLAEAFVIPTGSMATTLLGYHKDVVCDKCGFPYQVNCSAEAEDPHPNQFNKVRTSDCPNCGFRNQVR